MNAPEQKFRVVGAKARRIEDPALLRGQGHYLDDVVVDGVLHAAFVRSPHAHAKVLSVDFSAARAVPGLVAVYDAQAMSAHVSTMRLPLGFPSATLQKDITPWVLSGKEVAFAGEAVAMVVAHSRYAAEDAAALVEVEYDPLPAVADCRDAMKPDSPKVRSDAASNLAEQVRMAYGDGAAAFSKAKHVFREQLFVHRGGAHSMEGRGVVARFDQASGELTVWSSTQMSHELLHALAELLSLDEHHIRVIAPDVGGGFGAKFLVYPEEIAVAASARDLGRPVKWVEDRREHFISAIQERDQFWDVEIAVDADAKVLGVRGKLVHDQGAYTPQGINCAFNAASSVTGPYIVPCYEMDIFVMQTNKPSVVPVRGAGYPQAAFVMERLLDRVARELGLDRTEVRARNFIPTEKMPYAKQLKNRAGVVSVVDSGDYLACQEKAKAAIDYAGFAARKAAALKEGRYLGLGFANCVKPTGRGPFESALVRVSPAGRITIYTGALAMGQGIKTALAQVCAEQLGVEPGDIEVTAGDTGFLSMGLGGFASRQAVMAGSATHMAASEVRDKALKAAASMLEASEKDLVLRNGRVEVNGAPGSGVTLGQIAKKMKGAPGYQIPGGMTPGLEATSMFQCDAQAHANACHAVELEVDIGTGAVTLLRYVAVQDSGRLINPMVAEGQVHGAIVHGIGNALFEKMGYDEQAQPISTTFADYLLVTATELPHIEVLFNESPSPTNPLGVKGIGETGTIPVAPAIISGIEDALSPFGVRVAEAPVSPVRVLELLDAAQKASKT
jgi:carbon-monoxide dehydrogenase large subunit